MVVKQQPIESHEVHSQRLMRHADEQLTRGDRLQASEKTWGAAAHALKVIAERRGWTYRTHADAFRIVERLSEEMGEPRLKILFSVANGLHQNFYEDARSLDYIRTEMESVKEFLSMMERAGQG